MRYINWHIVTNIDEAKHILQQFHVCKSWIRFSFIFEMHSNPF